MPWITINLMQGRTADQKKQLHAAVAEAVSHAIDVPKERIRIQLVEMAPEDYSIAGNMMT